MVSKANEKRETKKFLPMLLAVIITILIYLFILLLVDNFEVVINYVFLMFIYVFLYISFFNLFNNFSNWYKNILEFVCKKTKFNDEVDMYFSLSNKSDYKVDNGILNVLRKNIRIIKFLYVCVTFGVILFIIFIWQLVIGISIIKITCILSLVLSIFLFFLIVPLISRGIVFNDIINDVVLEKKKKKSKSK